jgi:hypothetical protein
MAKPVHHVVVHRSAVAGVEAMTLYSGHSFPATAKRRPAGIVDDAAAGGTKNKNTEEAARLRVRSRALGMKVREIQRPAAALLQ